MNSYLFPSQKNPYKPISPTQVYRILNDAAEYLGRDNIGTHTMRKTFGYHHYKKFKNISILQDIFNHAAPSITIRYIGINIESNEVREPMANFRLG